MADARTLHPIYTLSTSTMIVAGMLCVLDSSWQQAGRRSSDASWVQTARARPLPDRTFEPLGFAGMAATLSDPKIETFQPRPRVLQIAVEILTVPASTVALTGAASPSIVRQALPTASRDRFQPSVIPTIDAPEAAKPDMSEETLVVAEAPIIEMASQAPPAISAFGTMLAPLYARAPRVSELVSPEPLFTRAQPRKLALMTDQSGTLQTDVGNIDEAMSPVVPKAFPIDIAGDAKKDMVPGASSATVVSKEAAIDLATPFAMPSLPFRRPATPQLAIAAPSVAPEPRLDPSPKSNRALPMTLGPSEDNNAPRAAPTPSLSGYQATVWSALARSKQKAGQPGSAMVSFGIGSGGQLAFVRISRSSGKPRLDQLAVATVRRAAPFPPPPESLRARPYTVRIDFD